MSVFTEVFGGGAVQPSDVSFQAYTIAADLQLVWPSANVNSDNVVARIMHFTANAGGLFVTMPQASQASPGSDTVIRNIGVNTITINDYAGNQIANVGASQVVYIYLEDNSTAAGTWGAFIFGTGTSQADAASLAGYGLTPIGMTLNTAGPVTSYNANHTVGVSDRASLLVWTGGAGTFTLDTAATYGNNFFFGVNNQGAGSLLLSPSGGETIDAAASLSLSPGSTLLLYTDGLLWYSIGRGQDINFAATYLNKSVAGSADVTLTSSEAANLIHRYFGVLGANINVIVPSAVARYYVRNDTTGAFTLTVKTAAGTGVSVPQGQDMILKCDGTNVSSAFTNIPASSISFPDGSAGSPGAPFASETNTGIYRPSAGSFAVSILGTQRLLVNASGITVTGSMVATGQVKQNGLDVLQAAVAFG